MQIKPLLWDRSAVLLLGVCVGTAIGISFLGHSGSAASAELPRTCVGALAPARGTAPEIAAARQCGAPSQRQLLRTLSAGAPVKVAVFGDSFGDGVWFGLQQELPRKGYSVVKYSRPATGFTRYRQTNLEKAAEEQLGNEPLDIAVISFGANDTQGVITDKGEYGPLMSPKWQAQIGERLDRFVALLRRRGAMVYWVGLPRMRDAKLDADVTAINNFYAARMARLEVPFVDTRPIASDPQGRYAAYLPDPRTGRSVLMREGDGIHMSMTGYRWITRGLAGRIHDYVDATRALESAPARP